MHATVVLGLFLHARVELLGLMVILTVVYFMKEVSIINTEDLVLKKRLVCFVAILLLRFYVIVRLGFAAIAFFSRRGKKLKFGCKS